MSNEPRAMQEVHEIRLKIQEETKSLTEEERINRVNNSVREVENRLGIKFLRPSDVSARKAI